MKAVINFFLLLFSIIIYVSFTGPFWTILNFHKCVLNKNSCFQGLVPALIFFLSSLNIIIPSNDMVLIWNQNIKRKKISPALNVNRYSWENLWKNKFSFNPKDFFLNSG